MVNPSGPERWLTTPEAAARLGVKPQTLYAYVARGVIDRHRGDDGRTSRFDAADIESLARRGRPRRRGAESGIDVTVHSAITSIPAGPTRRFGHLYRGRRALDLAGAATFESVAGWLLDGDERPLRVALARRGANGGRTDGRAPSLADLRRAVDASDAAAGGDRRTTAERVLAAMVATAGPSPRHIPTLGLGDTRHAGTVAARLAVTLRDPSGDPSTQPCGEPWAPYAVNTALVLLADHELATSTLAARVAASTRAAPAACVVAALATLSGPLHGTAADAVLDALDADDPAAALRDRAGDGPIPGFGHPLYDRIDPRCRRLLDVVRQAVGAHPGLDRIDSLVRSIRRGGGPPPNVDLGLAAVVRLAGLRSGSAAMIFAIARTAGWLAHVAEELDEAPLRYRARAVTRPTASLGAARPPAPASTGRPRPR